LGLAIGGKARGERMLAGTAAENKNSHDVKELTRETAGLAARRCCGLFR